MVRADPITRSCLEVVGDGSASTGLALHKLEGFDVGGFMAINAFLAMVWFLSPRIDNKINSYLESIDKRNDIEIANQELRFESNFQKDIPAFIFILNFAILATFSFVQVIAQ